MTPKQLNEAKLSQLVDYHNQLAESGGFKTVKSFKDKETAIKRIAALKDEIKKAEKAAAREAKKATNAKHDDPLAKVPGRRGAVARFDYEPGERQTAPRPGTLRGRAFELLQTGTTPDELEDLVVEFWKEKGIDESDVKIGKRLRALELVRLLRYQNGYGFTQDRNGKITVIGEIGGSKPKPAKNARTKAEADDVL